MAILRRPDAREDLDEIATYLQAKAGADVARRFVDAADESFAELEAAPFLGSPLFDTEDPRLKDLRHWPVAGFRRYVIIYKPMTGGVEIVRVVHGRRNISALLRST